mgnify:CR=1 FL=1
MLIIAIPKSASSSLVSTLCSHHSLDNAAEALRRKYARHLPVPDAYKHMAKIHYEFRELNRAWAEEAAAAGVISKFHIPPTQNNCDLLRDIKKVILLRAPENIIDAYHRGDATGVFPVRSPDFCFSFSKQGWHARAQKHGVLDELHNFEQGWRAHDGDKLVIDYDALVNEPQATLNRVESYFGLPETSIAELSRQRYTRQSAAPLSKTKRFQNHLRRIFKHAKKTITRKI